MDTTFNYELGIIGSILINEKCISDVSNVVVADDFVTPLNQTVYGAILDLYAAGKAVDPLTIITPVVDAGYRESDVMAFARDVMLQTPTATNAVIYANELHKQGKIRRLKTMLETAITTHSDADALSDAVLQGLYDVDNGTLKGKAKSLKEIADEFSMWTLSNESGNRLNTGCHILDETLHGMYPGNLVLLAARPAVGKSAFAANLALQAAENGVVTVIFSCEMSRLELMQRYIANRADVNLDKVIDKAFRKNNNESSRIVKTLDNMRNVPLYIYDEPGISLVDIRKTLQTIKNVGFVVVDYIQLMQAAERSENRNLEISKISGGLKQMAREFGIPIMALSQLNRGKDETDEPGLTQLRDSGALEQDSDKVLMLWRVGNTDYGLPKIGVKVAKNRMGQLGTVVMIYNGSRMRFDETSEKYEPKKRYRSNDTEFPFD